MTDKEKAKELASLLVGEDQNQEPLIEILMDMAQWKEQQMIKNAVNAVVDYPFIGHDFPNIYPDYRELKDYCDRYSIKDNDEVKLIIIKEN